MLACLAETVSITGAPNGIHARSIFAERRHARTLERLGAMRDDRLVCEVCGTRYRSELQATYCTKTQLCRDLNAPTYRHVWVPQSAILSLTNLAISSCEENAEADADTPQSALDTLRNARHTQEKTFAYVRDTWPVSGGVAHTAYLRMCDIMTKHWNHGHQVDIQALCELCVMLIDDLLMEFSERWKTEAPRAPEVWAAMRKRCKEVQHLWGNPDYVCPELNDLYDDIRDEIFPGNGTARRPSLYVAGGRFLVIARGRAECRECIRRETGLVNLKIEGIGHGTKFDGVDEPELIRMFPTVPQIIDTDFN